MRMITLSEPLLLRATGSSEVKESSTNQPGFVADPTQPPTRSYKQPTDN